MTSYIAMWSGPRNISTALMRSFESRFDCFVSDEPFYAFYLHNTNFNHPLKNEIIASGQLDYNKIVKYLTGSIPFDKKIWYQKHMAHHILPGMDIDWIKKMNNCILIRHPKEVISSYIKKNDINNVQELGYVQQIDLYNKLYNETNNLPIIIDSKDLLTNPKGMLIEICRRLDIKYNQSMLSWSKGPRETDGLWGKYWYEKVEVSTGFKPYLESKIDISPKYKSFYDQCMYYYEILFDNRIILG